MVTSQTIPSSPHPYTHIYCTKCGHSIAVPKFCKNRFCDVCSYVRTRRVRSRLEELCRSTKPDKHYRLRFLTLSVSNDTDARELAKHLVRSFRNLRRRKWWADRVRGGCSVLEVTGSPGSWHVHIHAILESQYLPWSDLHTLWKSISGGLGVWINNISPSAATGYLAKYLTKAPDSPDITLDLNDALRGFRMFQPFGEWHNKLKPPPKKSYPCPICGNDIWLVDTVVDLMARGFTPKVHSP